MAYDPIQEKIRRFHISRLETLQVVNKTFEFDTKDLETRFNNAINARFDVYKEPYEVQLFIQNKISNIIQMRPISNTQRIISKYDDGSIDISVMITSDDEIIPIIQKFMPNMKVLNNETIEDKIKANFNNY